MKVADIKEEIRRRLALPEFTAGGKNGLVDLLDQRAQGAAT